MSERTWRILANILEELTILQGRLDTPTRRKVDALRKDVAKVLDKYPGVKP